MKRVTDYIENICIPGDDLIDTITVNEAHVACQIQELETIKKIKELLKQEQKACEIYIENRLEELNKRLNKIKY